jgi:hypothetical protein
MNPSDSEMVHQITPSESYVNNPRRQPGVGPTHKPLAPKGRDCLGKNLPGKLIGGYQSECEVDSWSSIEEMPLSHLIFFYHQAMTPLQGLGARGELHPRLAPGVIHIGILRIQECNCGFSVVTNVLYMIPLSLFMSEKSIQNELGSISILSRNLNTLTGWICCKPKHSKEVIYDFFGLGYVFT